MAAQGKTRREYNVIEVHARDYLGGLPDMKPVRLTRHALEQCSERGTNKAEVTQAIEHGAREPAKLGRMLCRFNFPYNGLWQGKPYAIKQVAPVIKEESDEIVVITVYTFYF